MIFSFRNFFKKYSKQLAIFAVVGVILGISSTVFAQVINPIGPGRPIRPAPMRGTANIYGFAWMGTGIENPEQSEGGGGWLKFNCEPEYCEDSGRLSRPWGVKINLDSGRSQGLLTGEAWSNNYGWLSFDPTIVRSCWQNNPSTTASNNVARVTNLDITDPSYGNTRKVAGWAKFIAGDDDPNDGWDGCVNFNGGEPYGVTLDLATGDLAGWAWGSDVVGWISFKNPECRYCDTSVSIPGTANINFWAEDTVVPEGQGTTLRWEAVNSLQKSVVSCTTYNNTNGYSHWQSTGGDSTNVGTISTGAGNLPNGSHPIGGLTQTTTYTLNCQTSDGGTLPQKIATVTVVEAIKGCMDPIATNYNPLATMPDDCTYDTDTPSVSLTLVTNFPPNFLPVGSSTPFDYQLSPRWTFTSPSRVDSCTGKFFDDNGNEQSLLGWTNADLATPTANNGYWVGPHSGTHNVGSFASSGTVVAGDIFAFRIECLDIEGNPFGNGAEVVFQDMTPPETPTLNLEVEEDVFIVGSSDYGTEAITWSSSNPSLIQPNSCVGTFRVNSTLQTLTGWSGSRANPNQSIASINVASFANSAPDGTIFRFMIRCQTTSGTTLTDEDTIIMDSAVVPPSPLPIVDLRILTPDNGYGPYYEILPDTGGIVNLGWSVQNATSCTGSSVVTTGSFQDSNNSWDSYSFAPSSGSRTMDMTPSSASYANSTFILTCTNDDGASDSSQVTVLVDGMACPPTMIPPCSPPPGSNIPGYEEF